MTMNNMKKLEALLHKRFGFEFLCQNRMEDGYPLVQIRLADLNRPHGFSVVVRLSWKSLGLQFVKDSFSGDLIRDMGHSDKSKRIVSSSFALALNRYKGRLNFKINGDVVNPESIDSWPAEWSMFELNYDRMGVEPDLDQLVDGSSEIFLICLDFFGIIVSLLPVEQGSYEEPLDGLPEGALVREEVNRYERNRLNREACIAIKGSTCLVCDFNFSEIFGDIGDGFIHVHHILPISKMGEGYVVDPSEDLVPVCANCHSMMHRSDPPLSVDELKAVVAKNS